MQNLYAHVINQLRTHKNFMRIQGNQQSKGMGSLFCALALGSALAVPAEAQIVNLTSGNSTALIDPNSQAGMFHWDIQGQNQLAQQWFWYSIGSGPVQSINTIGTAAVTLIGANEVISSYTIAGTLNLSIQYTLTGGNVVAPGQFADADIAETIKISNIGTSTLPIHFYQYSDFDLNGANADTVQLGQNIHGLYNEAVQTGPGGSLSETVVTPGANHGEIAPFGSTLAKLNSGGPVTLGNVNGNGPIGPGDVTWALQWDPPLNAGSDIIISKDKNLEVLIVPEVPEPSMLALGGLALAAIACKRRMKS
jgi:hypothetical protein